MFATLDDPEAFLVHDMRFHQTVAAASGNRILTSLMNMVATILFDVRSKTVKARKISKESGEMHRTIYRAIRKRNAKKRAKLCVITLMLAQKHKLLKKRMLRAGQQNVKQVWRNDGHGVWSSAEKTSIGFVA